MHLEPIVFVRTPLPPARLGYVLLDRDGVLNEAVANGYVTDIAGLRVLPGAAEAVAELNAKGYGGVVISNQQCVGKGLVPVERLREITDALCHRIHDASGGVIDAVFYCPHLREDDCTCRKPRPGMILAAQQRFGFDLSRTYFIGDSYSDMATAAAAGCPAVFVLSGLEADRYRNDEPFPHNQVLVANDLQEAVAHVLANTAEA